MDTTFTVENYGPIKKASGTLTPLHAFIGPNDSGKSSLLRALVSGVNGVRGNRPTYPTGDSSVVTFDSEDLQFVVNANGGIYTSHFTGPGEKVDAFGFLKVGTTAGLARFEPDQLRAASGLVPEEERFEFIEARGAGLPGIYDMLLGRNDGSFQKISDEIARLFPSVLRLKLKAVNASQKLLAVDLKDGKSIDASRVSEGLLYYLAYAALRRISGLSLLAVEEPETGLHPSRISEVMRILREISQTGTTVLIATHSPLVVNELQPNEVSVVTRTNERGTQVRGLKDTPNFDKRSKVYALGELWLSYANGCDEAPLFEEKAGEKSPA